MIKKSEARMLPADYTKYLKVQNTKKTIKKEEGLFTFPDELKGNQETGERPFLVFYFDSKKQYETVRKMFEIHGTGARSHPDLSAEKLHRVVKSYLKKIKMKKVLK